MAIQVRRGNEADFDASKMLPGEWAVSLDTQYVRMCFAPGVVLRMATYEGFENEKAQIQAILAECQNIQSAVERIQAEVNAKASLTIEYSNSAKESADRAYEEAERAKIYASNAEAVTGVDIATKNRAGLVKGGDNYIAEDGTLMLIKDTASTTLSNSYSGRIKFNEIGGAMEQGENPSPTNPQEIRNVSLSGIKTHGKNLLDCRGLTEQTVNGVTFTPVYSSNGELEYINANGTPTATAIYYSNTNTRLDVNKRYIITDGQNGHISTYYTQLYNDNISNLPNTFSGEFVPEDLIYAVRIIVKTAVSNLKFYPMIRYADVEDATYEPYTESVITLSQPIDLYGKDGVQDILNTKQINRKYVSVVFDGSDDEVWNGSSTVGRYYMNNWGCKGYGFLMCSQAKGVQNGNEELNTCYIHAASNGRFIINTEIPTLTEWKAHLQANPMTVVYELAEETTEELPIADQIALNSLQTFYGITYVEFISDVQPTFQAEYGTSKVGGYTLEGMLAGRNGELLAQSYNERLSALEASVVNNI